MQDNSSEEHKPKSKIRGRKRCARIDDSDSEDINKINDSNEQENSNKNILNNEKEWGETKNDLNNDKNEKQLELQKKLKFIFNEVREKGKYEYNKQEIPENLKYHSDESDSSEVSGMKKSIISRKTDKNIGDNDQDKNINSYKRQISDRNSERQSGKMRKSKKSKDGGSLASISSRKKSSNNNSDNKNKEITDFIPEDNLKKIKEENEYENLAFEKKQNGNKNNLGKTVYNISGSGRKNITRKKYSESNSNLKNNENNFQKKSSMDSSQKKISHYSKYSADINSNSQNSYRKRENEKTEEKDEKEKKSIKNEKSDKKEEINEVKKEKNLKLRYLLENKKDILLKKCSDKEQKGSKDIDVKEFTEKNKTNNDNKEKEKYSYSKRRKYKTNKFKEEEIIETNKDNNTNIENNENNNEEKEEEFQIPRVDKSKNNVRDIIERLKAKKNEREDLARQEKEAEEQSIMRRKNKINNNDYNNNNNDEEKTVEDDTEAEREAEKIRQKEKRMEERRLAREKRRKMEEEERIRKEKEFEEKKRKEEEEEKKKKEEEKRREKEKKREEERRRKEEEERRKREKQKEEEKEFKKCKFKEKSKSRKNSEKIEFGTNFNLPKKFYKDEEENDDEMNQSNSNNKYQRGKQYKYSTGKKLNREEEKRRKQLEKDLEDEINKNELSDENEKNENNQMNNYKKEKKEIVINDIANTKLDRSFDAVNTYKKPVQKNFGNGKAKIYRPKRPGGVVRGRSHEKVEQNILNKINKEQGFTNENPNYVLTAMNSKKLNGNNFINSPNMAYSKKRSIGGLGENNFLQLNKSFGEYRGPAIENGNNNIMNGMYNINTLELSSLPDLNSSFDSRMLSYNNNMQYGLNSEFYNRTAQKNYHNNTINPGNLVNNSNRFTNMNNFFGMNNMGNISGINGISYINGDNDNFINMSNLNNNNSFYDIRQTQISPYDLNSSYNIGYNNPLANYPNNQVNLSNLLSNNYLGLNNNIQRDISNYNNQGNNFQNIYQKKSSSINIEDLLVLEEKLSEISIALNKTKIMNNECFEFWNYYYNCSFYGSLEKLFTNVLDSNNVQISINYILMSVLICYDCSFDIDVLNNVYSVLKDLLNFNHKNLMLIYEHILSKISTESRDNIWVLKLLNIVNSSKNSDFNDYNMMNGYSMTLVEKINFNTGIIIQNIRVLLKNFKTPRVEYLTSLFKKINEKSYEDINNFFRQYILRVDNMNGSILASVFLKDNTEFRSEPAPYLHTTNHKPYSLVLDLDETLVHFKVNPENESEGVLKVRPGVMEFLDDVDKYYELIIFTCATQDYANLLIDAIEENKIYFEHRLYRQHTVIIDNDFVKDLTRIGRPLDKIAIVDNMPQNFRLQKENGINIKAFWGEDIYDNALIELSPILINIAKEGGDIRKGLAKYRDQIVEKVTSNISKHNI